MLNGMTVLGLNYPPGSFEASYFVNHLYAAWESSGHKVIRVNGIQEPLPDADVVLLHVDLTKLPPEYLRAVEDHPVVINRAVRDISKPVSSALMVRPNDAYHGRVIVKTKANYGGIPELTAKFLNGGTQFPPHAQRPWRKVECLTDYPVFDSLRDVPPGVWKNQHLEVEKFLPERGSDDLYRVRIWIFFGNRSLHYMNVSKEPVIKSSNTLRREDLPEADIPDELKLARSRLGFDYGKFDYIIQDGKPLLFDINKTPAAPFELSDKSIEKVRTLSEGLAYYAGK